jgi:hypothetical protein
LARAPARVQKYNQSCLAHFTHNLLTLLFALRVPALQATHVYHLRIYRERVAMVAPISRDQTHNHLGVSHDMSLQLDRTKMDADASDDDGLDAAFDSFLSTEDTTFCTSLNLTPATTLGKHSREVNQTQSTPRRDGKRFTF